MEIGCQFDRLTDVLLTKGGGKLDNIDKNISVV